MACLADPPSWLVFAAIAALSGIIGNASYDAVKQVIRRCARARRKRFGYTELRLTTDDDIEVFVRRSQEYLDGLADLDRKLVCLIREEERADLHGELVAKALRGIAAADPEAVSNVVRSATREVMSQQTPAFDRQQMQRLLSQVWNELPDSGA